MTDTPSSTDPCIRFSNVSKRFGTLTVLDDFNFTVAPGEKVTLIGPSGSGKSTVLRILMTLEPFQDGTLELKGLSYHEPGGHGPFQASEKHLRQIAAMSAWSSELQPLPLHMTVLRNDGGAHQRTGLKRDEAEARASSCSAWWVSPTEGHFPASFPVAGQRVASPGLWPCARACALR